MESQRAPIVVVTNMLQVVGLDAYTGRHVWEQKIRVPARLWSVGDLVIVVSDHAAAYRIATGQLVWRRDGVMGETVVAAHGVVVIAGGGSVTALGVDDGRVLWHDKSLNSSGAIAMEAGPTAQADRR
jgi:outer membrane protein assembly factor BamB